MKKGTKRPVKLLLLGQSESGKTATLKSQGPRTFTGQNTHGSLDFQSTYANRSWTEERLAWKPIIYLNLIRNVNDILTEMSREMANNPSNLRASITPGTPASPFPYISSSGSGSRDSRKSRQLPQRPDTSSSDSDSPISHSPSTILASASSGTSGAPPVGWSDHHRVLQLRLTPLRRIQSELEHRLGAGSTELTYSNVTTAAPFGLSQGGSPTSLGPGGPFAGVAGASGRRVLQEFSINSSNGWKSTLERIKTRDYCYGKVSRDNVRRRMIGMCVDLSSSPIVRDSHSPSLLLAS
jgi:guanine nucleotide-binding protein alpha-1 subunit